MYLFPHKLTEIHIAIKANETNTTKNLLKARCHCNGKVITMYLCIPKSIVFCFTHILGQAKNVPNITKSQKKKVLMILSLC